MAGESDGPDYRELIAQCRFHFPAYRDFLLNRGESASYGGYLARRPAGGHPR